MVTAAQLAGMTIEAGAVAPVHALNELRLHLGRLGPASADAGRLRLPAEARFRKKRVDASL